MNKRTPVAGDEAAGDGGGGSDRRLDAVGGTGLMA